MTTHKHLTINVRAPGHRSPVPIDREIAPLIEATWALGIETIASCQDFEGRGVVQLVLPSSTDAHLFLTVVARNASKQVARDAARVGTQSDWQLRVWSAGWERGKFTSVVLFFAILFPRPHLAKVTRALASLSTGGAGR